MTSNYWLDENSPVLEATTDLDRDSRFSPRPCRWARRGVVREYSRHCSARHDVAVNNSVWFQRVALTWKRRAAFRIGHDGHVANGHVEIDSIEPIGSPSRPSNILHCSTWDKVPTPEKSELAGDAYPYCTQVRWYCTRH